MIPPLGKEVDVVVVAVSARRRFKSRSVGTTIETG